MTPRSLAKDLLAVLARDAERLQIIDDYMNGLHDDPYMPANADAEYRLLAKRSVSNWMPLLVGTPSQALYVDGFRRGTVATQEGDPGTANSTVEWSHWQRSRMDARQTAVHRAALAYGHSFVLTEKTKKGVISKGLSPRKTAALFEDPANDDTPFAALTITTPASDGRPGRARMWDGKREYVVSFKSLTDEKGLIVVKGKVHGASECPVTRFACLVDLDGRTVGVIEPMIALQNRINQTVFDLLVAQTYGSFKVRYATGMAPPMMTELVDADGNVTTDPSLAVDTQVKTDSNGQPIPVPINHNARRFLFAEDENVKFGSLDETPLDGFIKSIDMSIRHLAAVSQTPPHHLLGQIANLSAEALLAAETSLARKVEEFRSSFGESWERVFRLAAELEDESVSADDFAGEVIWRDMESRSLAQSADALGKLHEQLGIPERGLWKRVPGVTQTELADWERLHEEDNPDVALGNGLHRATGSLDRTELSLVGDD